MGITVLTLANASLRDEKILDHQSGEMVDVKFIGYKHKQPEYVLIYPDGKIRSLVWTDGQATAGKESSLTLAQVTDLSTKARQKKPVKKSSIPQPIV